MRSTLTQRGQTVVPAAIRKHFGLSPADGLEWVIEGENLRVSPVRADPVAAFRGRGKGGAAARLKATQRLSLADAWIAAAADLKAATLGHKDPEFSVLPLPQQVLPYK